MPLCYHRLANLVTHGRDGRHMRIFWCVGVGYVICGACQSWFLRCFFVPIRAESDYFVVSLQPKQALWEKVN